MRQQGADVIRQAVVVAEGATEPVVEQGLDDTPDRVIDDERLVRIADRWIRLFEDAPAEVQKYVFPLFQNLRSRLQPQAQIGSEFGKLLGRHDLYQAGDQAP